MAEQPMIEISQNDNLERVIRICNTNFRAISANSKISTGTISDDVAREMAAMAQAFNEELDSEARIRASADDDLEDMITGLDIHFLPITGGTITGDLDIEGDAFSNQEQFYFTFKTTDHTQYTPVASPCFVLDTTEMELYYYDNGVYTNITNNSATSAVTGVKGDAESTYRTGNVNLTPADIGAVNLAGDTMIGDLNVDGRIDTKTDAFTRGTVPSANVWPTDTGIWFNDSEGTEVGHLRQHSLTDGYEGIQLETTRTVSGSSVNHALRLEIDANGNRRVNVHEQAPWLTGLGAAAASHTHSYLPLSGGTLTGIVSEKNSAINRDAANPSSDQWGDRYFRLLDADGELIGIFQATRYKDGRIGVSIGAWNETTGGVEKENRLHVYVARDGTQTYSVANPTNFRTAIGLGNVATRNVYNRTTIGHFEYSSYVNNPVTNGAICFWNGAYNSSGTSNLSRLSHEVFLKDDGRDCTTNAEGWGPGVYFNDKNNKLNGYLEIAQGTAGDVMMTMGARQWNGSTQKTNYINVGVNRSGTNTYSVCDPTKFRQAIGAASSSDRRLKSNIKPLGDEAVDFIMALEPCEYDINGEHQVGLIAQDVHEVDAWETRMAFETEEGIDGLSDWEKMEDGSPTWKLDYIRIIPPITAALQDAMKRIDQLEARVAELEAKLDENADDVFEEGQPEGSQEEA